MDSDEVASDNGSDIDELRFLNLSVLDRAPRDERILLFPEQAEPAPNPNPDPEPEPEPPAPENNIPPILLLPSEEVFVTNADEEEEQEEQMEVEPLPAPMYHDEIIIHPPPRVVVPPRVVPMALSNHEFKILMRRIEIEGGNLIWNARLYEGRNRNPPDWEPERSYRDEYGSDTESDGSTTDSDG